MKADISLMVTKINSLVNELIILHKHQLTLNTKLNSISSSVTAIAINCAQAAKFAAISAQLSFLASKKAADAVNSAANIESEVFLILVIAAADAAKNAAESAMSAVIADSAASVASVAVTQGLSPKASKASLKTINQATVEMNAAFEFLVIMKKISD